jgi:hypothetical protein
MSHQRVRQDDQEKLAAVYNAEGSKAVYQRLRDQYQIKNPSGVVRRMKVNKSLGYNLACDQFLSTEKGEAMFLNLDDLCKPTKKENVQEIQPSRIKNKSADRRTDAMEKLVAELIGERLLELNQYVRMDTLSKMLVVNKTALTCDGYQLVTR